MFLTKLHQCIAANGASRFSTAEGDCRECRQLKRIFGQILAMVGGEEGFAQGVKAIRVARASGKRGDSVNGRVTRKILNAILKSADVEPLLNLYRGLLENFGIILTAQQEGQGVVYYHDYGVFPRAVQASAAPRRRRVVAAGPVDTGWRERWQEQRTLRREERAAVAASTQNIVLHWQKDGEGDEIVLGPNDEHTRKLAAKKQAAGREAGYIVSFQIVESL